MQQNQIIARNNHIKMKSNFTKKSNDDDNNITRAYTHIQLNFSFNWSECNIFCARDTNFPTSISINSKIRERVYFRLSLHFKIIIQFTESILSCGWWWWWWWCMEWKCGWIGFLVFYWKISIENKEVNSRCRFGF